MGCLACVCCVCHGQWNPNFSWDPWSRAQRPRIVWFTDLRVEISCPEGVFTIDGFGDGALNTGALSTASLELAPETKVSGTMWGTRNGAMGLHLPYSMGQLGATLSSQPHDGENLKDDIDGSKDWLHNAEN